MLEMVVQVGNKGSGHRDRLRSRSSKQHGNTTDPSSSLQSLEEEKSEPLSVGLSRSIGEYDVCLKDPAEGRGIQGVGAFVGRPPCSRAAHATPQQFVAGMKLDFRTPAQLRQKTDNEKKRASMERKSNIFSSIGKFQALSPVAQAKGHVSTLKRDVIELKQGPLQDEIDDSSLSLGSLPPPDREERSLGNSGSALLNASLNLSARYPMNASSDFSGNRMMSSFEQITTSATDEQWARFKLLGRLGLGSIQLSAQAQVLVERNYGIMLNALKYIYCLRDNAPDDSIEEPLQAERVLGIKTGHLLEEMYQSTIDVPSAGSVMKRDPNSVCIESEVRSQLKDYIVVIASLYQDNSFHDYEHASNVLSSVDRLIGLVSLPQGGWDYRNLKYGCGIAREPWNHFALVFSAMIHDVDHNGVPNAQLIKEKAQVAGAYKNKCVAEQNSIELAWNLLMEPCYRELREGIFKYRHELTNFRKLVVTAVLATDIADKELAALRKGRAADALKIQEDSECAANSDMDLISRKATFVVETLIQVADVSHTMSSFSTFKKWNHRLYKEMYKAFRNGRAEQDPTLTWYKGEFGFFDFYIIPLAKKLNDCGISGDAGQEYLSNAVENRRLWEEKGEYIVKAYVAEEKEERASEEARAKATPSACSSLHSIRSVVLGLDTDGEDASDIDSVSISSDDESEDSSAVRILRTDQSSKRDRRQAMAGIGKVASKSSRMCQGRKPQERSQSLCSRRSGVQSRPRSESPSEQVTSLESPVRSSRSERMCGRVILKSSQMNVSPASGSERSERRVIWKKNKTAEISSPESLSTRSEHRLALKISSLRSLSKSPSTPTKTIARVRQQENPVSRRGNRSSGRSKSPASTKELLARSRSQSPARNVARPSRPKAKSVSMGGRPTSHSISPSSVTEESSSREERKEPPLVAAKALRRGRRPSRSRSPGGVNAETGMSDDGSRTTEKGLKRGKRPTTTRREVAVFLDASPVRKGSVTNRPHV